jgi:LmbE family N-acetylglucosaminyl deacetylase
MLTFNIKTNQNRPLSVLCLGAHSDDIEIGCGGTVLELLANNNAVEVRWAVLGSNKQRDAEASDSAQEFLQNAQKSIVALQHFRDGFFPYQGHDIKEYFEDLKINCSPDLIFTHCRHDLHQDHRLVSELTWNTFRDHLILEYEIMKYDGDLGSPNTFVPLNRQICDMKVALLMKHFKSQAKHKWFTKDAFLALMRLRGVECNASEGLAEAFYGRKVTIALDRC